MLAAIIILSMLLISAVVFIFWLFEVLKNTFNITESAIEMVQGRTPKQFAEPYDGKYYPAAVIAQVKFNSPSEGKIVDWSMYETHKIIGFTIMTTDKLEDYYGKDFIEGLDEEDMEKLLKPILIKKAVVYAPREGDWLWKSME